MQTVKWQKKTITDKILAMLKERQEQGTNLPVAPSSYWADFAEHFEYIRDLSPDSLRSLRFHTYHLTGDNYQHYYFYEDPSDFFIHHAYEGLISAVPSELVIQEPERGMGIRHPSGRLISLDILRYQRVIRSLYLNRLLVPGDSKKIVEIGGGYGGLALHIGNSFPHSQYFIIDIPETLIFSANYLQQHAKGEIYLYDQETFRDALADGFSNYQFILLPNYVLSSLKNTFDLAISVESLQEMTERQVEEYRSFVSKHVTGTFYCWNQDRNPKNSELKSLYNILSQSFSIQELKSPPPPPRPFIRTMVRKLAVKLKLADPLERDRKDRIRECLLLPLNRN